MTGIPEEIVERVRAEANIVDVIGDYVRLRRTGKNWVGLCPFHDDRKPSLNVEPVKGIFKCFACGKGGNAFTFLMERNGWTFPESVRHLAAQLNIEIPESGVDRRQVAESERLVAAVADAARFYQETLRSDEGEGAMGYLRSRGLTDATIDRFGLGYAPDAWERTLARLSMAGYENDELEKAGLVLRREGRTSLYDRFRDRVMFPIYAATGRVVGFGARRLSEDPDQPKYINSPDSPIYHKSQVLYGLFQAKEAIRRQGYALMVEGYLDVISLHQGGIATAIAPCGTALADEHASLISRYTNRVVLAFDSDRAGVAATEKGIDILLRKGIDVAVVQLPDGEDPDTFVRRFGAKELEGRVGEGISFLDFKARHLKRRGDLDAPERQAEAVRSIVATIALVPDALKRELFLQKIAADFFLPETLLNRELERALGEIERPRFRPRERRPEPPMPTGPDAPLEGVEPTSEEPAVGFESEEAGETPQPAVPARREPVRVADLPPAEVALLSVLVEGDPLMLEHVFTRIDPDDFAHPLTRELVGLILGHYVNQRSFAMEELMMEEIDPDLRDLVSFLAIDRESISPNWAKFEPNLEEPNRWKVARDCLIRITQEKLDRESRAMQQRLSDPELDDEGRHAILLEFKEMRERVEGLRQMVYGA